MGRKSTELKARLPDYTCPTINKVYDFLRACRADDLCAVLDEIRRDNGDLRAVAKDAIRELRKLEDQANGEEKVH
jgi:hypothetical protein